MSEQLVNNAVTTLNGAIDDNDLTLVVTSATGFPTTGEFRIIVKAEGANSDELMLVTAVNGTTFTVLRAYEATAGVQTASAHASGATVAHVLTAGALRALSIPTGFIGAKVYNSAVQAINNTTAALTFNSEEFDTDNFHDTSSNTSRMTIPAGMGGKYLLQVSAATSTSSMTDAYFQLNGATRLRAATAYAGSDNGGRPYLSAYQDLSAGDYVECFASTNSSCNFGSATQGENQAVFSITKLDSGKVGQGVGAKVRASANQTVNNGPILYDTEEFDSDGFHSIASNTSRMTIPTGMGGKYLLTASAYDTTGNYDLRFFKNGSVMTGGQISGSTSTGVVTSLIVDAVASDYYEANVYTNGGNHTILGGNTDGSQTTFSIMRLDSNSTGVLNSAKSLVTSGAVYSTTSTSWVDIDATNLSSTFITGARRCLITFTGMGVGSSGSDGVCVDVAIDGTRYSTKLLGLVYVYGETAGSENLSFAIITDVLSAGSHTFKMQHRSVNGGATTIHRGASDQPPVSFSVQELTDSGSIVSGSSAMTAKGTWLGANSAATSAGSAVTADIPQLIRVVQVFGWTPTHMGVGINVSAGTIDIGIYADNGTGLGPGALICKTGNVSSPGTGRRTIAIATPVFLPPGIYWYALVASTGSFSMQYTWAGTGSGGSGPWMCGRAASVTPAGTLPTTLSSVTNTDTWAAAVWAEIQ